MKYVSIEKNGKVHLVPKRSRGKIVGAILALALVVSIIPYNNYVEQSSHIEAIPPKSRLDSYTLMAKWVRRNNPKVPESTAIEIVKSATYWSHIYNLDPLIILALIKVESRFNIFAVSSSNALGLTQFIPHWHKEKLQGKSPFDINDNIRIGACILREYLNKYDTYPKALQQYNGNGQGYHQLVSNARDDLQDFLINAAAEEIESI